MADGTTPGMKAAPTGERLVICERWSRSAGRYVVGALACAAVAWLLLGPRTFPTIALGFGALTLSAMFALLFLLGEFMTLAQLARSVRSIEVRPEGFTVFRQTRTEQFAWSDIVGEIRVERREARACLVFEHRRRAAGTAPASALVELLADGLELRPEQIAKRMNVALRAAAPT